LKEALGVDMNEQLGFDYRTMDYHFNGAFGHAQVDELVNVRCVNTGKPSS
jgi:hypothetical protein